MEVLQHILVSWIIVVVFLFQNVGNVYGGRRHHSESKEKSEFLPELSPADPSEQTPSDPPVLQSDEPTGNSSSTSNIFNVVDCGAVGDGETDDTTAFRSAWKEACRMENGTVLVPSGLVFLITSTIFTGPCEPGLSFQVDGVLMPPDGPESWPKSDSNKQWLVFYNLNGFTFTGSGTIEGNGQKWWDLPCKPHKGPNGKTLPGPCNSPALIRFFMSYNLVVTGLRIQNSPQFHMKFDACAGVLIDRLSISSPKFSPNTDGIHIENTKYVGIYNSVIGNGNQMIQTET